MDAKTHFVFQLQKRMSQLNLTKTELARKLETSRAQLDRILDPHNNGITMATLFKVSHAVGCQLYISAE